jgi:hypothetical protein
MSWLSANSSAFILILTLLVIGLGGVAAWLVISLRRVERKYETLTAGTDGGSLESVLDQHVSQMREATGRVIELDALTRQLERSSRTHLQHVGFLRFNPFRDTGGDQSFVIALGDQDGNGVIVSSLHSRDVTRVYAKPLVGWQSSYQLTDEEQQAIRRALGQA